MRLSLNLKVLGSNFGPAKLGSVFNSSRHFFEEAVLPTGTMTRRWAPQTCYTILRITASIMKDLIWFLIRQILGCIEHTYTNERGEHGSVPFLSKQMSDLVT